MSHYSDAARKAYIVIHHSGGNGNELYGDPYPFAAPYSGCDTTCCNKYDFAVNGYGAIQYRGRHTNPNGCHEPSCNCEATGIIALGCFGCGNDFGMPVAQKCSIAYIWHHTGIGKTSDKLRPHQWCDPNNPCNTSPGNTQGTACPGTFYTSGSSPSNNYWNTSQGVPLRNTLVQYANEYATCGTCDCG